MPKFRTFQVIKQFVQKLYCEKCEEVEMKPFAPAISIAPGGPQRFTHICPKCGVKETVDKPYPQTIIEVVEVMEDSNEN